ncbi:hypothetical protein PQ610_03670 [Tardisphaera miroshnichenkoae]
MFPESQDKLTVQRNTWLQKEERHKLNVMSVLHMRAVKFFSSFHMAGKKTL